MVTLTTIFVCVKNYKYGPGHIDFNYFKAHNFNHFALTVYLEFVI